MSFSLRRSRKRTREETQQYLRGKEENTDDEHLPAPPTKRSRQDDAIESNADLDQDYDMKTMNIDDADDMMSDYEEI